MRPWLGRERQVRKWWPRRSARHMPSRSRISQPPTCAVGLGKSSPTPHAPQAAASARTPVTGPCCTFTLAAPRIGQVGLHSSSQRSQPQASESNLSIGRDRFCRGRALPLAVGRSPPPHSTRGSKREVSANLKARSKVGKQGGGCDVRDGKRGTRDARRQSFSPGSDGEQLSLDRFALLSLLVVRSWWRSGVGHLCFSNTSTTPERRPRDS